MSNHSTNILDIEKKYKIKNSEVCFSMADHPMLNKNRKFPLYFKTTPYDSWEDFINEMINMRFSYTPSHFNPMDSKDGYGYRKKENFLATNIVGLDIDDGITMESAINRLKELDYPAVVLPTKSHQIKKNDKPAMDRFRVLIPVSGLISSPPEYKLTCEKLSLEIVDGKSDPQCHEAARYFNPTPKKWKKSIVYIDGNNLPNPVTLSEEDLIIYKTKIKKVKKKHNKSNSFNVSDKEINVFQKYLNNLNLKHTISHYNDSNNTFNLYRDKDDQGAGCFMFKNDIRIFDNKGNNVDTINHTFEQISEGLNNRKKDIEVLRKETQERILNGLKQDKDYNVIITSEGVGKSMLAPKYMEKFNKDRIIIVCKSYEQLLDKQKMYDKFFPDKKIKIIYGSEKILERHRIHYSEWIYGFDEETGEKYVNLVKTIQNSSANPEIIAEVLREVEEYKAIYDRKSKVDIILMVQDKLRVDVIKDRLISKKELILWDEFHPDHWFEDRLATKWEQDFQDKLDLKIYKYQTWQGFFSNMIHKSQRWFSKIKGHKIVLSTETKAIDFFKKFHENTSNIINEWNIFYAPTARIHSVNPGIVIKDGDHKEYTANAFRANNKIVIGNGIKSKINHVSMLGQNYHDRFTENDEVVLIINKPSPGELAPIMKNLEVDDHEATKILLTDVLNQYLGRFYGYRSAVKIKNLDIIIPSTVINEILPELRYVCDVSRNVTGRCHRTNKNRNFDKILYSIHKNLNYISYENNNLFLKSLHKIVEKFEEKIDKIGTDMANKFKGMKFYKFSKKQVELSASKIPLYIRKANERMKYSNVYAKDKLTSILYSIFQNENIEDLLLTETLE